MKLVSVFMDVEDPINPLADDAALDFAQLFTEIGITGSFCITGEKCRTLAQRGRLDVAKALLPHSLGLHTNTHSFHPTTMELLAEIDYEEGCRAALESESKGCDAFRALFHREPAYWGGAGNTWSPEITDALQQLKIPAYVYALTELPNFAIHQFNGSVALPQALSISELEWADPARANLAMYRVLNGIETIPQPWIGIFVGHPTKFRHVDYWDHPYYNGRTPSKPEFTEPLPEATYRRAKDNLTTFLEELRQRATIVGIEEVVNLPWRACELTPQESEYFCASATKNLRTAANWPPHRNGLSANRIIEKTLSRITTVRRLDLPK